MSVDGSRVLRRPTSNRWVATTFSIARVVTRDTSKLTQSKKSAQSGLQLQVELHVLLFRRKSQALCGSQDGSVDTAKGNCILWTWERASCGWWVKRNHGQRYHPYRTPQDLDLEDAVPFVYVYQMKRWSKIIARTFWVMWIPPTFLTKRRKLTITFQGIRLLCR